MATISAHMTAGHALSETHAPTTGSWLAGLVDRIRREAQDRRLRDQLAEMDDAMLRDIGIADDEMHMIRSRDRFTPRAWTGRAAGVSRWEY